MTITNNETEKRYRDCEGLQEEKLVQFACFFTPAKGTATEFMSPAARGRSSNRVCHIVLAMVGKPHEPPATCKEEDGDGGMASMSYISTSSRSGMATAQAVVLVCGVRALRVTMLRVVRPYGARR